MKRGINMAKCTLCGNKIKYNQFETIDGKVYCPDCAKGFRKSIAEIIEPTEEAKAEMIKQGIKLLDAPKDDKDGM